MVSTSNEESSVSRWNVKESTANKLNRDQKLMNWRKVATCHLRKASVGQFVRIKQPSFSSASSAVVLFVGGLILDWS